MRDLKKVKRFEPLKRDIKNVTGTEPSIYVKKDSYCAEIQLPDKSWYCVDSNAVAKTFNNNPPCFESHLSCE